MKRAILILPLIVLVSGCIMKTNPLYSMGQFTPSGGMNISDLLSEENYNETITVEGEVSALGELSCACFHLTSGQESIKVRYELEVETVEKANMTGIENGDYVIVTGELKKINENETEIWAVRVDEMSALGSTLVVPSQSTPGTGSKN